MRSPPVHSSITVPTRNAVVRRMPCASSATLPRGAIPQRLNRPKAPTARPSRWLRNGHAPASAHCHRGLGMLYATTGQGEQAHTKLSAAVDLYHAMEMTFWLPETEAALAQVAAR